MKLRLITTMLLAIFLTSCNSQNTTGVKNISQDEMIQLMESKKVEVIDVRTPAEVSEVFVKDANYFFDVNNANFASSINSLDKSKTYVVYCRSGARSGSAANYMIQNGFKNVYNLTGGLNNWKKPAYLARK
jgi:rhodanese-related sulfurtransferase